MAGTLIEVTIDSLDINGDGVARDGRTRIVVPFTIPGERVRIERRRDAETCASVDAIVRASPHRVTPRCPHFGPCGGCAWQHIAYPEQLRLKSDLVRRLLAAEMGGRAPAVLDTLPATPLDDPWGYRHKAHFVFGNAPGGLVMGHYARGSQRIVPVRECPVHDKRGNAFAFRLRDAYVETGVRAAEIFRLGPEATFRKARSDEGTLRSVAVRVGAGTREMMATLVVTHDGDKRLRAATRRALDAEEAPDSFHLNLHARPDPFIFGPRTRRLRGPAHLREQVGGLSFLVSPTTFFQTNVHAAGVLVRLVLEALPAGAPVLDLYAGAGLFALPIAARGDRVLAIEENAAATDDGVASLRLNRIPAVRCRFLTRRVETALRGVTPSAAVHVVLDPPREGCEPPVLDEVFGRLRPARAVYVSCNPVALARDLAGIAQHGYLAERVVPIDMFPHTPHIETVALLRRR